MKSILAMIFIALTFAAGCTTVVVTDAVEARPVVIAETYHDVRPIVNYYHTPHCYWVKTPVYRYADVYRDGYPHVRIKEVAYINQQRRCN